MYHLIKRNDTKYNKRIITLNEMILLLIVVDAILSRLNSLGVHLH